MASQASPVWSKDPALEEGTIICAGGSPSVLQSHAIDMGITVPVSVASHGELSIHGPLIQNRPSQELAPDSHFLLTLGS